MSLSLHLSVQLFVFLPPSFVFHSFLPLCLFLCLSITLSNLIGSTWYFSLLPSLVSYPMQKKPKFRRNMKAGYLYFQSPKKIYPQRTPPLSVQSSPSLFSLFPFLFFFLSFSVPSPSLFTSLLFIRLSSATSFPPSLPLPAANPLSLLYSFLPSAYPYVSPAPHLFNIV